MRRRLDLELARRGLVASRSQAESYIKLGKVRVNGKILNKSSILVGDADELEVEQAMQYVSRAALKLAGAAEKFNLNFKNKIVLDVGSSTGGFTDYALKHGAKKVVAVDVGTDQLHQSLRDNPQVELYEKTDIRSLKLDVRNSDKDSSSTTNVNLLTSIPDIVLIDVSFISLRQILSAIVKISSNNTQIVAMLKPQFEAQPKDVNKGVIKNDSIRRKILKDFETWTKNYFTIIDKVDSPVSGSKGNVERFYLLQKSA